MEKNISQRVEKWKKLLLDFSKRNRLYSFHPTKRTNLEISLPEYGELYSRVVLNNESLKFACPDAFDDEDEEIDLSLIDADIATTAKSLKEQQKSLYVIRQRAKSAFDEQGVNVLYLIVGLLRWKPHSNSDEEIMSPLILVPVQLSCENLVSPFKLELHDSEEVLLNPTLKHKLISDHNIILPEFDSDNDSLEEYIATVDSIVASLGSVQRCVHMTLLSFLKMSMYEDINKNVARLSANPHIRAICGASASGTVADSCSFDQFDHDNDTRPHDVFQIRDADSSQMDAILAAKRGLSFVLQGPPGTGKSQTIANIIAESLAEGKKVLFVSEKRAALDVVYKRLKESGLGDFCFALHDHKANRRQILNQLQMVMEKSSGRTPALNINQLDALQRKRKELNRYHNDLHTPCSGYNMSVFQIIGKLAKLSAVPDVIFDIPSVDQLTEEYIDDKCELLKRLAAVIGKRSEDYELNCWRYATAESFTQTLIHDIDAHLSSLTPNLRALRKALVEFHSEHKNEIEYTINKLHQHKEVLQVASECPGILSHWIDSSSISNLSADSRKWESLIDEVKQKRGTLADTYEPEFFGISPVDYLNYLNSGIDYLTSFFKSQELDSFVEILEKNVQELAFIKESLDSIYETAAVVADELGVDRPGTRKELQRYIELCERLKELPAIPGSWFDSGVFTRLQKDTPTHSHRHERVRTLEKQVRQNFDDGVFDLDYESLIRRFRTEYSSFLRFFKPSYYRDLKEIKVHCRNASALTHDQVYTLLNSLKERDVLIREIENTSDQLKLYYGEHYSGTQSDWELIRNAVTNFSKLVDLQPSISDSLKDLLQSESISTTGVPQLLTFWQTVVPVKLYTRINELCVASIEQDKAYSSYSEQFNQVIAFVDSFIPVYAELAKLRKLPGRYTQILQDIETLQRLFELEKNLEENNETLSQDYGFYYRGLETDWASIRTALEYSTKLKETVHKYNLSSTFVENLSNCESMAQQCVELLQYVEKAEKDISEDLKWFANMFPTEMQNSFYNQDLSALADRTEICHLNKHLLEEWIDFQSQRKRCAAAGLAAYVQHVENGKVPTDLIVEAYLKRFYVLWIDAIKNQFPVLDNFRGNIHEELIKEFRELDKLQMKIAVKRIQKKLWDSLPDFRVTYSHNDEVSILKRELQKKSRLKSLRRLFGEIPNLATALKPCFMMSPLSVSIFLGSEAYNFDLVIFDEASQVHTEDAIGAIMRGKQVIIVGDDKQLPPTSFFRATMSEDDFDDEESDEYYDDASFESILAETKASGFREHSLRWHYRSRQEDLIAFSNIKLYGGNLVTFPSTTVKAPDCGVEFVHVADGCYERKKSKGTNPREAQKVAELVFEHFRKYGKERSLGVVAFSEAQQSAIETAILDYRRKDDMFEPFFNEDAEEAFFVKNLENVQGDERDTIIFSVGYAKDETSKMYMNFGPLNRVGGERRLNVAVTRAKHNVKLVSSILPTDIDLDRTNAEGVKLLRSYLEFAQQGIDALINEVTYNSQIVECESPFEESVYDYLTSRGYQVQTQVGCSDYRIDMAVKHPTLNGKFAIGIECDGATYHSSRTARERDRLRQANLEDRGWTLYRIWSTDWIKSPESQGAKLEEAIRAAFEKNTVTPPVRPIPPAIELQEEILASDDLTESLPMEMLGEESESPDFEDEHFYGFIDYEYAEIEPHWSQNDVAKAITHVIGIEQPIHIYELAKRLLPLYKRQKVTGAFRGEVEWELSRILKTSNIQRKGDFLQFADFTELKVRIPSSGGSGRDIDYIPAEEIKLAFIEIAKRSYGIPKDELIKLAANQFGFMRRGGKIMDILERVYQTALADESLVEIEGKVSVLNN